ncbi:hypothetical protein [Pedobacter montanisoli]|uniref:PH domain-containing protein n=1 Tax=Pedobacter montanisoli TaxID=2923277 RepID=A0ABS9ZVB1_9SPHI|nr:hypothetical protein [Pedobacter montanisoli]MCJ0741239.1 hypothetical protein [Pedobacter montanisoli]
MIKIKLKKRRYKLSYFVGPLFVIMFIMDIFLQTDHTWRSYSYFFLGVSFTLFLFLDREANYILIDDENFVVLGRFFSRRINLNKVTDCEIKEDVLKIICNEKATFVNLTLIEHRSSEELISFLNQSKLKQILIYA